MSGVGDIKDDVVIIFKERIAGPIGYVVLSFIAYNWSWFYILIFSTRTAESKVKTIFDGFEYFYGFFWPLVAGSILAVITPFIRVGMIKITAFARKLEDKTNYQIKNHLDEYTENSRLELIKKKEEIIERESRINSLIDRKKKIEDDIKIANETLTKIRAEDGNLITAVGDKKRELHSLDSSIAEMRLDLQNATATRERLHEKSVEYSILRRNLIILKDEISKVNMYFSNHDNLYTSTNPLNLFDLKEAAEIISDKIKGMDGEYFKIINFEFKNSNREVVISSLKHNNWSGLTELLINNGLESHGFIPNHDNSITLFFNSELNDTDKEKIKAVFTLYLENH